MAGPGRVHRAGVRADLADRDPEAEGGGLAPPNGPGAAPDGRGWGRGDPAGPAEREEFWAVLHGCLRKLPPRLHDAFALRYLDEAAGAEVCRELGLAPSNLHVTLHRARLRMWHCLSRNWFGGDPPGGGDGA